MKRCITMLAVLALASAGQARGQAATAAAPANPKIWENYDFVPGSKVIYFTDFSEDIVGNFARRLKYKSGPVEVVERDGVKMLRATGAATVLIPLGRSFPSGSRSRSTSSPPRCTAASTG